MNQKLKSFVLNIVMLIVVFSILEIALRLINVTGRNQEEKLIPIVSNKLTYKDYLPNSAFLRKPTKNDEFGEVSNEINALGIRGPEIGNKESVRVLNIGDSFIQAEEVEFDKTFGEILNEEFKDSIEFISHGISSWSPTPIFSWIIHKGVDLRPDHINLFLCINDFYRKEVLYTSDANYRKSAVYENGLPIAYKIDEDANDIKFWASLELVRLPVLVYKKVKASSSTQANSSKPRQGLSLVVEEMKLLEQADSTWNDTFKTELNQTLDVVVKMNEYLKNKNIGLNVYMIPTGFCWENESAGGKLTYGMQAEDAITQKGFENYLIQVLNKKHDIKTHILYSDIDIYKHNNPAEKLYFAYDGHWNDLGHQLVAEIISNNMKKKK